MIGWIYIITNQNNNKKYIGQTISKERRHERHLSDLRANRHHSHKLQRAYNKYGENNFSFEYIQVEIKDINELWILEKEYIQKFNTYHDGYNETLGGEGHPTKFEHSIAVLIYQLGKRYDGIKHLLSRYFKCDRTTITAIFNRESLEDEKYDEEELLKLISDIGLTDSNLRENYEDNFSRKLSSESVIEILAILELTKYSRSACAAIYGSSKSSISSICSGRTYKAEKEYYDSLSLEDKQSILNECSKLEEIEAFYYQNKRKGLRNQLSQQDIDFILDNKNKISQTKIAETLGISIDRVSSVVLGKSYCDLINIYKRKHSSLN